MAEEVRCAQGQLYPNIGNGWRADAFPDAAQALAHGLAQKGSVHMRCRRSSCDATAGATFI
eukprot:scaffold123493_cov25-Tisochrysis_lutea.AAC.5